MGGGILIWSRPPKNFRPLRGRISSFLEVSEQIKISFFSHFFFVQTWIVFVQDSDLPRTRGDFSRKSVDEEYSKVE